MTISTFVVRLVWCQFCDDMNVVSDDQPAQPAGRLGHPGSPGPPAGLCLSRINGLDVSKMQKYSDRPLIAAMPLVANVIWEGGCHHSCL